MKTAAKRTVLLTYRQAAERSGTSYAFWQRLGAKGVIPVVRLGYRSCRLREDDVERILREGIKAR